MMNTVLHGHLLIIYLHLVKLSIDPALIVCLFMYIDKDKINTQDVGNSLTITVI